MKQAKRVTPAGEAEVAAPTLGLVEWFRPGEYDHVEAVLADLRALGMTELHTGFSWADWHTDAGKAWYDWLLPRLAQEVNVLPCFTYTPPSLGLAPKTSSPPRHPKDYADFLDVIVTRLGAYFEWVELWNEPNNLNDWDWRLDPSWQIFCTMVGGAAYWMHQRGKKTVLGGMCPTDPNWLDLLCRRGVLQYIDAVGVHGFRGTWEFDWQSWSEVIAKVQGVLAQHRVNAEIWITEAGYSTWRHDEYRQLGAFMQLAATPVQRAYWYAAYDLHPDLPHQDGFHEDERHYHFGLKHADGQPKLLFRVWATEGLAGVRALAQLSEPRHAGVQLTTNGVHKTPNGARRTPSLTAASPRPVLITGGAGFIGTNLAHRLLSSGHSVCILDNLARPGVERNLHWLRTQHAHHLHVHVADIRNPYVVREAVAGARQIFHFAAQVAVTTSLEKPVTDFEINVRGTLNLLEALRALKKPPPVVLQGL